jgi:hypothetical protein
VAARLARGSQLRLLAQAPDNRVRGPRHVRLPASTGHGVHVR